MVFVSLCSQVLNVLDERTPFDSIRAPFLEFRNFRTNERENKPFYRTQNMTHIHYKLVSVTVTKALCQSDSVVVDIVVVVCTHTYASSKQSAKLIDELQRGAEARLEGLERVALERDRHLVRLPVDGRAGRAVQLHRLPFKHMNDQRATRQRD